MLKTEFMQLVQLNLAKTRCDSELLIMQWFFHVHMLIDYIRFQLKGGET